MNIRNSMTYRRGEGENRQHMTHVCVIRLANAVTMIRSLFVRTIIDLKMHLRGMVRRYRVFRVSMIFLPS